MNTQYALMTTILGDAEVASRVCDLLDSRTTPPTLDELTRIRGVGASTAAKVLACMELSATYMVGNSATVFTDPEVIARRFCYMKFEAQEHFCVMTLDSSNHEIACHEVTTGLVNCCPAHPREVFRPALLDNAVSIALIHNHPSGNSEPSGDDIAITRTLCAAAKIMKIAVIDHVVVSKSGYTSICRRYPEIFEQTLNR